MIFIVNITYTAELSRVDRFIDKHIAFLERHYQQGLFLLSGPKQPRTGGFILAQADSLAELQAIVAQDPFYRETLADYTITEFIPTKHAEISNIAKALNLKP